MRLFLDIDGVLAQFMKKSCETHGKPGYMAQKWDYFEDWGLTTAEFWDKIDAIEGWWDDLELYDNALDLIKLVEKYDPNFKFLSAPHNSPCCYSGKFKLIKDLGYNPSRRMILTASKEELAFPGNVLIDEGPPNIEKFTDWGGEAILYPATWNDNRDKINVQLEYTENCLKDIQIKFDERGI